MEQQLQQLTFGKAVIGGVVLAVLYFFIMYNNGATLEAGITSANAEIQTKEAELEKIKTAVADAERYQNTKRALGAELDSVLKAIPAQLTSEDLRKIISREAQQIGANSINISAGGAQQTTDPNQKPPFFEPVTVNLEIEGTYNQLMSFLSAVTKVDKIITLSSLNLVRKEASSDDLGSTGPVVLKMAAELRAYRYLPSSAPKEATE